MPKPISQRDVPCGCGLAAMALEAGKRPSHPVARGARRDHLVDEALAAGDSRREVLGGVRIRETLRGALRVTCGPDLATVDDLDGLDRAHDAQPHARPGEHEVGAEILAVHRDVSAAKCLSHKYRDAGHARLREGVHELPTVADDPRSLLGAAGQKTRGA